MSIWYWVPVPNRTGYIRYRFLFSPFFGTGTFGIPSSKCARYRSCHRRGF
ncbi:hypothetical protein Hanom_Chr16g01465591 [Helianthus anomalus]